MREERRKAERKQRDQQQRAGRVHDLESRQENPSGDSASGTGQFGDRNLDSSRRSRDGESWVRFNNGF